MPTENRCWRRYQLRPFVRRFWSVLRFAAKFLSALALPSVSPEVAVFTSGYNVFIISSMALVAAILVPLFVSYANCVDKGLPVV